MPAHFLFLPNASNNSLECHFPNYSASDIYFNITGSLTRDNQIGISSFQIRSRPTLLKKGCVDLHTDNDCECKFLNNYLKESGITLDLIKDTVSTNCKHRFLCDSDDEVVTNATYGFHTKAKGDENVVMKSKDFARMVYGIVNDHKGYETATSAHKNIMNYLKDTIKPGDEFLFVMPGNIVARSAVPKATIFDDNIRIKGAKKQPYN